MLADSIDPAEPTARARARAQVGSNVPPTCREPETQTTASLPTMHGVLRSRRRLTPNMLEVTLAGFARATLCGGDDFVYVLFSQDPRGIDPTYSMADFLDRALGDPVHGAYYTVRRSRPDGEVDLWVVDHRHDGSASSWFGAVPIGAPIALWGPRRGFDVPADAQTLLCVADETGFAAVAALLEQLPADRQVLAVLETVDAGHRPAMPAHPGLRVEWVDRGSDEPGSVEHLLARVAGVVTAAPDAAFGAAESRQISTIRRYLRSEHGVAATRMLMTGYWRRAAA